MSEISEGSIIAIEAGKFYRTRSGAKVGPMRDDFPDSHHPFHVEEGPYNGNLWAKDGVRFFGTDYEDDLVAEWDS